MSTYKCISNFGQSAANNPENNPLTYCLMQSLDNEFNHGAIAETIASPYGRNCQAFMAEYCAKNGWNDICEYASQNNSTIYPNNLDNCSSNNQVACNGITAGEALVANTAARKYLSAMSSNCSMKYEPFDPTVAASPLISYWSGSCNEQGNSQCIPIYEVDPAKIDKDPVMNKILSKPIIAWSILVNIYNTAVRLNKLDTLKGTKIHKFFMSNAFQHYIKQKTMTLSNKGGCCCGK